MPELYEDGVVGKCMDVCVDYVGPGSSFTLFSFDMPILNFEVIIPWWMSIMSAILDLGFTGPAEVGLVLGWLRCSGASIWLLAMDLSWQEQQ